MTKTTALLIASLTINIYFLSQLYVIDVTEDSITVQKLFKGTPSHGVIYREECPAEVTKNRICSVELLEKRSDFAMIKIHYHYLKNDEVSNRIVIKANKGSHDNTVGTKSAHHLKEGSHTALIPFGLYKATDHKQSNPYISEYIVIRARGISKDSKHYIAPHLLESYIKFQTSWYAEDDETSW